MSFVHLHVHDATGSRLDSVVGCAELAKRAKELGHTSLAVTNHGSCASWFEHQKACDSVSIKPILGLEQYIVPDDELVCMNDKGKRVRSPNNHIVLLAKNEIGLKNILHLHYLSHSEENHYYYNNHNTFSELFKYHEGIICGTACMMSPFSNAFKRGDLEGAENMFKQFLGVFGEDFYVEVQLNELVGQIEGLEHGQKSANEFMMRLADKYGVMKVITGDVHYLNKEDYKLQDISIALRDKRTMNDTGFSLDSKTLFYHDVDDYKFFNKQFGYNYDEGLIEEMCANTQIIADKCNARIPERDKMIFPNLTLDDEYYMEKTATDRLNEKFNGNPPQEYKDRLAHELDLMKRKGFGSYVSVLSDIFRYCEEENIPVGFGRGSGAGSLVLWLMNITKLDPLRYGLLFERFVSDERCVNTVVDYFS